MLEHQKLLLENVSSDKELFRKEIIKSFRWLKSYEIIQLHHWLNNKFGSTHKNIIKDIFQYVAA